MQLHPKKLLRFLRMAKHQNLTMRRRLLGYLFALCSFVALLGFFMLNLLGLVNPFDRELENALIRQLDTTTAHILHDADDTAAWGLSLSEEISAAVDNALKAHRLSFEDLRNNETVLTEIQRNAYNSVYTHMQLTTCSGAFYMLNTTVNDTLPENSYNGLSKNMPISTQKIPSITEPACFAETMPSRVKMALIFTAHGGRRRLSKLFHRRLPSWMVIQNIF